MKPWKVKKQMGGVKRKALREYKNIIRLSQNQNDEPTSADEKNYTTVNKEALHIVKKQCFLNQNPEIDLKINVIPGNSKSTIYKSSELDNNSCQLQTNKQGSVQQQIISDVEYPLICEDLLPLSSSNNSDDEQESEIMKNNNFINDLRTWALQKNISQSALKHLLSILNNRFEDILPSDPRTLLHTPTAICLKTIEGGEYWHHGIIMPLANILENCIPLPNKILLNINIDGLPIFKSSKYEFWPILANIYQSDTSDPFIIGIYYGKGKPKNLNNFLEDFVNEMGIVLEQGVYVKGANVNVKVRCFICDSPARAYVKGKFT
ncbi:unnamed protein product [Chilo suppressalis]|uniref:Transposase domain-containing protein n=1 Tax=Chilo suppressalis TaxID=168631 RepID=A0ABN8BA35_CHISP|nr:unnamed protein product [Chilo suppressalis]